jgi:hypothetical protein
LAGLGPRIIMMEEKVNKRIGNLQLRKAVCLGKEPDHVSYHINKWEPNGYYGNEAKFVDEGDYYRYPDDEYNFVRIHKSCFKNPETCYAIASFDWDDHEEIYELRFVGDRPLYLSKEEREIFWQLIELGEKVLNTTHDDE